MLLVLLVMMILCPLSKHTYPLYNDKRARPASGSGWPAHISVAWHQRERPQPCAACVHSEAERHVAYTVGSAVCAGLPYGCAFRFLSVGRGKLFGINKNYFGLQLVPSPRRRFARKDLGLGLSSA